MNKKVLWITQTAVFTALLVTAQFVTAPLGNQYITGSIVNMILITTVLTCGLASGITVGVISQISAFMVGVGPVFPPLIPFIVAGNIVLVLVWFACGKFKKPFFYITPVIAAAAKFLALYVGIVLIALPLIFNLSEAQNAVMSVMFSYPQLITATIGGFIALAIVPRLKKALRFRDE